MRLNRAIGPTTGRREKEYVLRVGARVDGRVVFLKPKIGLKGLCVFPP